MGVFFLGCPAVVCHASLPMGALSLRENIIIAVRSLLGSGRTVCSTCVARVTGEHVVPVANRLLASIIERCLPHSKEAAEHRLNGNEHFKNGRWQEAVDAYSVSLQVDATSPAAFANRSFAHLKMAANTKAVEDAPADHGHTLQ